MPVDRTMSMPVRRCVNIELSRMGRAPTRNPKSVRTAMTSDSMVSRRARDEASTCASTAASGSASAVKDSTLAAALRSTVATTDLEGVADVQDGGADDDHEESR